MKNLYLINFLGGTAGNFIQQLLIRLITKSGSDIQMSINGGAHVDCLSFDMPMKHSYQNVTNIEPVYRYFDIDLCFSFDDYIAVDHVPPNWDELFTLYPTCKNIVITLPVSMALRVVGNLFFKSTCIQVLEPESNVPWQHMRTNNPMLAQYVRPEDVPIELLENEFRDFASQYDDVIIPPYDNSTVPNQYKDQICYISYRDIIHDMDKVLGQLKDFTGLELPERIRDSYQMYLDAQAELVKTKMPWVDDKYPYE